MSRTPLMRRLRDVIAAAHARRRDEAAPAGAPAPATLGPRWDRRRFLKTTGLAVAGAAAAGALAGCVDLLPAADERPTGTSPSERPGARPKVVVVGAGLAGLTAAYRLRDAPVDVEVYEAASRIGGRVWTRRGDWADGQISEHGGEVIDTWHAHVKALAKELGLTLRDLSLESPPGTEVLMRVDGAPYTVEEAMRDFKAAYLRVHEDFHKTTPGQTYTFDEDAYRRLDAQTLVDYVEEVIRPVAPRFARLVVTAYEAEYGADPREQSALNLVYLMGDAPTEDDEDPEHPRGVDGNGFPMYGKSDERFHVDGGNDGLVTRLVERLGGAERIRTQRALVAIARTPEGRYALTFQPRGAGAAPEVVMADRVVLAVPYSVLREKPIELKDAGFSAPKLGVIRDLGMGTNVKLCTQYASRVWHKSGCNGDTFRDEGYQSTWETSRGQEGESGLLTNFSGGPSASWLAAGDLDPSVPPPADVVARFLDELSQLVPDARAAWNGRATRDAWTHSNPYSRGAYAYFKPGQYVAYAEVLATPEGGCHFAGEHTSLAAQGFMEGAVESGQRAAEEIRAALGLVRRVPVEAPTPEASPMAAAP